MSLSDPLLKELKGYVSKLLTECARPITDEEPTLLLFCDCFERILYRGLVTQKTVIGLINVPDCWPWLKKLKDEKFGVSYSYSSSVEEVLKNPRVITNRGKVRLLIRTCMVKRCLHVPIQYLSESERVRGDTYEERCVLGEDTSCMVLSSILLCLSSSLVFSLQLGSAAFLDVSWHIPLLVSLLFVPTSILGLYLMFVNGKAIVLNVLENSVAAESGGIERGDVIDSINGIIITQGSHGSLSSIIKKSAKKPIAVSVIKGLKDGNAYSPLAPYWERAGIDPAHIQAKPLEREVKEDKKEECKRSLMCAVSCGTRGDLGALDEVMRTLPQPASDSPHPVAIECHLLGLKVVSLRNNQVLKEHSYMEISACGSSITSPSFFGFIAGDNYTQCKEFVCYVFQSTDQNIIDSVLKTIGEGFKRTLYTV